MNDDFINFLKQWLIKAEEDLFVEERLMEFEYRAKAAIGFHCQHSVEKYLKAFLIYHRKEISRTHNIEFLLQKCSEIDKNFQDIDPKNLTDFGVEIRYPGDFLEPSDIEIQKFLLITKRVKDLVETKIKSES